MKKYLKYLVFALILLYIPLWSQTNSFISSIGQDKKPVTIVKDSEIINTLEEKADMSVESVKVLDSDLLFGMMVGIPRNPQLILSRTLYESFNNDELEYVILHEAGHYKLGHSMIELTAGLILLVLGIFVLKSSKLNIFGGVFLGILFGIVMIQFGRLKEIQADRYSLIRMNNPEGMITATNKLKEAWEDKSSQNPTIRFLFYRGNTYENRLKMANDEIERRLQ